MAFYLARIWFDICQWFLEKKQKEKKTRKNQKGEKETQKKKIKKNPNKQNDLYITYLLQLK